jgi:hypothetical protein
LAEIKSTLEIIMEKTEGLTMSDEEKADLKQKELTGKIRGLVQKFLDGIMNPERFRKEVAVLEADKGHAVKQVIREEAIARFSLIGDNSRLLEMMEYATGMDVGPINDSLEAYEIRLQEEASSRMQALWEGLEQKGIRGSGVVPNLDADPDWKKHIAEAEQAFQEKLRVILK